MSGDRLARVRQAPALAGDAFARWCAARVAIFGAGAVGSLLAKQLVRRGVAVLVIDPDVVTEPNLGTQDFASSDLGRPKAEVLAAACAAIEPGRAVGIAADVRGVGAGTLATCDLFVDCTDDAALAWPLTLLANGLVRPLLRLAVDGSGARELCRALVSHGGAGHACQLCPLTPADLLRATARTPCPGRRRARPPTLAGAAVPAVVALGVLQAQRLLTGRDRDRAVDSEVVLDLDGAGLHALRLVRSARCASDHVAWQVVELTQAASALTLGAVFAEAEARLGAAVSLTPHNGPLVLTSVCACGARARCVGALHVAPPTCAHCGATPVRQAEASVASLSRAQAAELAVLDVSLADLALPDGAAVAARDRTDRVLHFVARPIGPTWSPSPT